MGSRAALSLRKVASTRIAMGSASGLPWRVIALVFASFAVGLMGMTAALRLAAEPAPHPVTAAESLPSPEPKAIPAEPGPAAVPAPASAAHAPSEPNPEPPAPPSQPAAQNQAPVPYPAPRPFGIAPLPPRSSSPAPLLAPAQLAPAPAPPNNWTELTNLPPFAATTPLLLTDGRVIAEDLDSTNWYTLTPDNTGSYINGTWSGPLASPQQCFDTNSGVTEPWTPLYLASAVLPDGRVVVIGGEYNLALGTNEAFSNLGQIYDPVANTWTCLSSPSGWNFLGDAMSVVLPDGTFLLSESIGFGTMATLNVQTNPPSWSIINSTGKSADSGGYNDEEGWTLLPNGKVLTLEIWNPADTTSTPALQYNPSTMNWDPAGTAPDALVLQQKGNIVYDEIGPAVLRPDGTVLASGATGNTAIYNANSNSWTAGPSFPSTTISGSCDAGSYVNPEQYVPADAPAALLPDGNVLIETSPIDTNCGWIPGTAFFEFDGTNLNQVASTFFGPLTPSYVGRLLTLPTGQVLFLDSTGDAEIYTSTGTPVAGAAPTITNFPATVGVGASNMLITGTQFNGLSEAVAYGDDYQAATNYPLVRITNLGTGHVFYARTHGPSTMGVATGNTTESTYFDVPANIETGPSTIVVVANGIASTSNPITILPASSTALGSSSNPSTKGALLTFTATVSGPTGTRNGTVNFYDGTDSTAIALASNVTLTPSVGASGTAQFQTSSLSIGTHTITAVYGGDATLGSSTSSPLLQVVNGQATTIGLVSATNPSFLGSPVEFTATVTPMGSGTPTGTVTFLDANSSADGNTVLATQTLTGGVAPPVNAPLEFIGTHLITAVYSGDSIFSGSTSTAVVQTVVNPVPTLTLLSPSSAQVGTAGFILSIEGSNFVPNSVVNFNGTARPTGFGSSTLLEIELQNSDLATVGIFPVTVTNPAPGGGASGSLNFTVGNLAPTLSSISPTSAIKNQSVSSLVLTGTNFLATSTVNFGSNQLSGGTVGSGGTTLTFTVPAADLSTAGSVNVSVTNPAPGGGTSGSVTFIVNAAGPATAVTVETKPDGTGTVIPAQNVAVGTSVTGYAITRDAGGNFIANVAATWSLVNITGGVVSSDLTPAADSKSATFTGHLVGAAAMHAVVSGLASTDSGTLTVVAGAATALRVETKPDGTGTVVPAQNVAVGTSVTGYAIGRDAGGNFVANVAATWSLVNITGGVVSSDLTPAADSKSATFTGHAVGTATLHAVASSLTSTDSGTLTVVAGTATAVRVETKPDGTGTVVPAQNVVTGTSVTGYAISRDASGNFVSNIPATWSFTNPTGGVVAGDLVASGDSKSATFTGHLVGTAAMHAVVSGLASTDSGTLTVVAGAATALRVETKPDGTGTVVPAQNVATGASVTGYAISRDASGNFVANVAATWSLKNPTGGVVAGDLVASGDGKSATFTGHGLGGAAMHAVVSGLASTDSGTLTVVAGTATSVRVETKPDGTGTVVSAQNVVTGTSVTGYAISRDAGGNFVGNVAATWSLANVTGGVVSSDLAPSGDSKSATFTGHLVGTATLHAVASSLTSTDSGTLTVVAGTTTAVRVETKPDGTGTLVPAQTLGNGNTLTGFAISRDASGNFVANVPATWSLANITGGVVSTDLVAAGDSKSATFAGHLAGTATIHAVVSGLASTDSGTITVLAGSIVTVRVETKLDGSGTIVQAQNVASGTSVIGYAVGRDASNNPVANVAAAWSLTNVTGGIVTTDLVPAGGGKSATFTAHLAGSAAMHLVFGGASSVDSGTLSVTAGTTTNVRVETKADGTGTVVPAQNVATGTSVTGYAISRDAGGNFVGNVAATWSLANITGGVVAGDLVASGDSKSATFTGHLVGTAAMHAVVSGLASTDSGTLTVVAGTAAVVRVETKPDGTGTVVPAQNVVTGTSVTGYAISRDAGGNFVGNVAATWSLANITGGVVSTDLVPAGDGKSATFTGHGLGSAATRAVVSGLTSTDSGTLTVVAGTATVVRVETKPDGTGTVVLAQNVVTASSVTVYAISRDSSGNFVANVAATWSLTNITGGVLAGDLVPAGDSKSATFTGHLVGTAVIHVVASGLITIDSGTLTVVAGTAAVVRVETKPDGSGTLVSAQNVTSGNSITAYAISRDPAGAFIANVAATWSLTNLTGGVAAGDLVPSGDGKSGTFTGHVTGTATIHVVSGALTSTDSGTITVLAGAAAKLVFGAQPSNSYAGVTIAPAVVVTITDAFGNTVTTATNSVTMAIGTNSAGGTLAGTTAVAAMNGAATFSNLSINNAARDYSLTASAAGLTGATSTAFNNVGMTMALATIGTVQVSGGTPANVPITLAITPVGAPLPATVNYACSVPASLSATTCAMNPSSTAAGSTSGSTTLIVTTTAAVLPPSRPDGPQAPYMPWMALAAFAGSMGLYFTGRYTLVSWRVRPAYLALALVVIAAAGTIGCTTSMIATSSTSTPKGSATITVTATSGGAESQVQVNISVN